MKRISLGVCATVVQRFFFEGWRFMKRVSLGVCATVWG